MIEINPILKPMCNDCKMFDPEMEVTKQYANDVPYLISIGIACKRRGECDSIERYLKETIESEATIGEGAT